MPVTAAQMVSNRSLMELRQVYARNRRMVDSHLDRSMTGSCYPRLLNVRCASMARARLAYLLFVIVGAAQIGALAAIGDTRFSKGGIVLMVVVAVWLGFRSRAAWWLFVVGNAWLLIATAPLVASSSGHTMTGNVIALAFGSAVMLAILLSGPMRTWVRPPADAVDYLTSA